MEPIVITKKIKEGCDMRRQSSEAHALVAELMGRSVMHSGTGRPIVDAPVDISITHKHDMICVGIVPDPYRIGVDVEYLAEDIHRELFVDSVVTRKEIACAQQYCTVRGMSVTAAVLLLWSIKEAFFKCLDREFEPREISVCGIDASGSVAFEYGRQIKHTMQDQEWTLQGASIKTEDGYAHACVVMHKGRLL